MDIEEIKKLIAKTCDDTWFKYDYPEVWTKITEALLNLTYPNGEKVLAIVNEEQTPPDNLVRNISCDLAALRDLTQMNYEKGEYAPEVYPIARQIITRMTTPDKEGCVWRRTKV